jgi:ubiquinone/menaquinone biosynthesis C-methylase UbiE
VPSDKSYLLAANRAQTGSECDDFARERYAQFLKYLPKKPALRIVDLGGGIGTGGVVLLEGLSSPAIIGIDCVEERVGKMPSSVYVERLCAFASSLPLEPRSVDAVVAGEFIEHVPPEEVDTVLSEIFRILKLRGQLLLTTPNPRYLKNRFKKLSVLLDPSHVSQHYPKSLRNRLLAIGFSDVFITGSGRVSRFLGPHFPLNLYGSYFCGATKW